MTLTSAKLRSVVNMLSDPLSVGAAANILATEAKERGLLVADLVAEALAPPPAEAAPSWGNVADEDGPYVKRIDALHVGLVAEIVHETEKARLVATPNGSEVWLPKSQCEDHGEDSIGRTILILPKWLARRAGIAP